MNFPERSGAADIVWTWLGFMAVCSEQKKGGGTRTGPHMNLLPYPRGVRVCKKNIRDSLSWVNPLMLSWGAYTNRSYKWIICTDRISGLALLRLSYFINLNRIVMGQWIALSKLGKFYSHKRISCCFFLLKLCYIIAISCILNSYIRSLC